ncbi:MAG: triose-phosphate isomerase [Chlamydiales bacterium]|nr:triose-phosphate isomerase [Chlamydiales bacterium]
MSTNPTLLCRWQPYYDAQTIFAMISKLGSVVSANFSHALPYQYLLAASNIPQAGADNMLSAGEKDFAGHFSAQMLNEANANFVLLGELEHRHLLQEDNATINTKVRKALEGNVRVMLCISNVREIEPCLHDVPQELYDKITLIYQGPWAGFYKDRGLIEDLQSALQVVEHTGLHIPLLLALPSRVSHMKEIVNATVTHCAGYYFAKATVAPQTIVDFAKAINEWQPPQKQEEEVAPAPVEDPPPPEEEPTDTQDA